MVPMSRASANDAPQPLSFRERQVLRLLLRGFSPSATARELGLPLAAVARCQARLGRKLHLHDRPVVHEYAIALGLLSRNGH
jgi:DNA-binding NarL/FixJ family response regulator